MFGKISFDKITHLKNYKANNMKKAIKVSHSFIVVQKFNINAGFSVFK